MGQGFQEEKEQDGKDAEEDKVYKMKMERDDGKEKRNEENKCSKSKTKRQREERVKQHRKTNIQ